jgi:ubiquinone/menaquinone biosynthesis C-methylase UbiE
MNGRCYNLLMSPLEHWRLNTARRALVGTLEGRILDLGAGTGANFPHFVDPNTVIAAEPDPDMRRVARAGKPDGLTLIDSTAEQLQLQDDSVDHVVTTLVLCTVADLDLAFQEMRRVLKPGGQLHFLEHVRGEGFIGKLHDWCTPAWSRIAGGCHLNRRTLETIPQHGFRIDHDETVLELIGTPFRSGRATPL